MKIAYNEIPDLQRFIELTHHTQEFLTVVEPNNKEHRVQKHALIQEYRLILCNKAKWGEGDE